MNENNFKSGKYQVIDKTDGRVIAHLTCSEKTIWRVKKMMSEYRIIGEDGKEVKDDDGGGR